MVSQETPSNSNDFILDTKITEEVDPKTGKIIKTIYTVNYVPQEDPSDEESASFF